MPQSSLVTALSALFIERGKLLTSFLDKRRSIQGNIAALGGVASIDAIEAVKALEEELRQLDEALGVLRYPGVPLDSSLSAEKELDKSLRLPTHRGPLVEGLISKYAPTKRQLEHVDEPYVSPIPPEHRFTLDEPFDTGETGYTIIAPGGGGWLEHPGLASVYHMYNKNGTTSGALAKYNAIAAAHHLAAHHAEDVEGNVINPPLDEGGWPPVSFAHVRRTHSGQQVESTPQVGLVSYLRDEGHAHEQAQRLNKRFVRGSGKEVPGSWYVPDMVIAGNLKRPPPHFDAITINWRDTPAGKQVTYTKGRALPGWHHKNGYVPSAMHEFIKSQGISSSWLSFRRSPS